MKFSYKAVARNGKAVQGVVEAKEASEVADYLRSHEFFPVKINVKTENDIFRHIPFLYRSASSDLVLFTRQLASVLTSGLTLLESLNIIKEQIQEGEMHDVIVGIIADIEEGRSFSYALAKYPDVFFPIYVSLVQSAEKAGLMDKILLRLADNLEKREKITSAIKGALIYPAIVVFGMIVVVIIMMIFVIPELSSVYKSLNVELPLSTRIVIAISDNFLTLWPFLFGFGFLFVYLFRRWHKTDSGKLIIDDLLLRLPVFGKLIKETILAEFTRTLSLLVGAGTLVVEALRQTGDVSGNELYKNAISSVARQVEKGVGVGEAMSGYPIFPPILTQMAKIGEQTGKLDDSLMRVSAYFESEVDQTTKTLTTAMEPIIMVILGVGVAFLITSIITPIYSLTNAIH